MLDRLRRALTAKPAATYQDGWRDSQAKIIAYLEHVSAAQRSVRRDPAIIEAAIHHIRAMEPHKP
jgi:hypothetical protein